MTPPENELPPQEDFVDANVHAAGQLPGRTPVTIHAQYVKDISFENPNSPESLGSLPGKPVLDVSFSMDAQKKDWMNLPDTYEVTVGVNVVAKRGETTAFVVEVLYAVLVTLIDVPEEKHHPMLMIEIPKYAYPYMRQIVSDMTQSGGFMPLMLAPMDFRNFYMQRFGGKAGGVSPEGILKNAAGG